MVGLVCCRKPFQFCGLGLTDLCFFIGLIVPVQHFWIPKYRSDWAGSCEALEMNEYMVPVLREKAER